MSYDIDIRTTPAQPILFIHRACAASAIQPTLAEVLPSTFAYALEKGAQPVGPPLTRYVEHDTEAGQMKIEGGCPIAAPIEGEGEIQCGALHEGEVAFTWHVGPYDKLGEAHEALWAWAEEQGREIAGAPWEVYWTDPGQEPDPSKWRTEVLVPIKVAAVTAPEAAGWAKGAEPWLRFAASRCACAREG